MKNLIFILFSLISATVIAKTKPEIYALYDLNNNKVLMSKNENEVHSMASLTKLMTAHVFLKYYPQDISQCVSSISEEDTDTVKHTHTRIEKEKSISCENLLKLMLLVSDNYAASAISRSIPNKTKEEFYTLMNKEANMIGMRNTYYKDATGLSFENKTTANDLFKLVKVLYKNEKIKELSSLYGLKLDTGEKKIDFKNSNKLIRDNIYSADISKTGYISESGYNLIFVPKNECNNKKLTLVVMGTVSSQERANFSKGILDKYHCKK